jgi:thiol-disulfide isomerase/thioredoxin
MLKTIFIVPIIIFLIILYIYFNSNSDCQNLNQNLNKNLNKNLDQNSNSNLHSNSHSHSNSQVEHYKEPVRLILLHANWCGYCKAMLPEWDKLEKTYKNDSTIKIEKYEESENPEVIKQFKVDGFPCIFLIKNDKVTEFNENSRTFAKFKEFLENN